MIIVIELDGEEQKAVVQALQKEYGDKPLPDLIRMAVLDANHFLSNMRMIRDNMRYLSNHRHSATK